ncbi:MAG: hypothetical protein ACLR8Y_00415 [Alistipes indistinctus]
MRISSGTGWCGWVFQLLIFIFLLNPALVVGIIRFSIRECRWIGCRYSAQPLPGPRMWFVSATLLVFELLLCCIPPLS